MDRLSLALMFIAYMIVSTDPAFAQDKLVIDPSLKTWASAKVNQKHLWN